MIFKNTRKQMKNDSRYFKRGQNTAEYVVMLVLVAVGTIGLFSLFGQSIKQHVTQAVSAMEGNNTVQNEGALTSKAEEILKKGTKLKLDKETITNYSDSE